VPERMNALDSYGRTKFLSGAARWLLVADRVVPQREGSYGLSGCQAWKQAPTATPLTDSEPEELGTAASIADQYAGKTSNPWKRGVARPAAPGSGISRRAGCARRGCAG
jgi:hypothetical protein